MLNNTNCLHFLGLESRQATACLRTELQAGLYSPSHRLILIFRIQEVPDSITKSYHTKIQLSALLLFFVCLLFCFVVCFLQAVFLAWNSAAQILRAAYPMEWNSLGSLFRFHASEMLYTDLFRDTCYTLP